MVEESNIGSVVNVGKWLKENEENFKPPVCNSVMAGGYLKIMFVGGPNSRKDYHLDQGEEFFFMLKGDMCLKIMEKGEPRDILIKEGEVFVLPSRIPHSPQRFENTLGLVIERDRSELWDGLRYYCEDGKTILYEKFFHLRSLVDDLLPVIKEYFASEPYKTGKPIPGTTDTNEKIFKVDKETKVQAPFSLNDWVTANGNEIQSGGKTLFENGEFKIKLYGVGSHNIKNLYETWLWVKNGCATIIRADNNTSTLTADDSLIVPAQTEFTLNIEEKSAYCMVFMMNPTATPQTNPPVDVSS